MCSCCVIYGKTQWIDLINIYIYKQLSVEPENYAMRVARVNQNSKAGNKLNELFKAFVKQKCTFPFSSFSSARIFMFFSFSASLFLHVIENWISSRVFFQTKQATEKIIVRYLIVKIIFSFFKCCIFLPLSTSVFWYFSMLFSALPVLRLFHLSFLLPWFFCYTSCHSLTSLWLSLTVPWYLQYNCVSGALVLS